MKIIQLASLLLLGLLLVGQPGRAQLWQPAKSLSADYLTWSAHRRLQASDFQFRARAHSNLKGCVGNFGLLTRGNTLELLGKKANAVVQNVLCRAGSYLDSADQRTVALQLLYLQTPVGHRRSGRPPAAPGVARLGQAHAAMGAPPQQQRASSL